MNKYKEQLMKLNLELHYLGPQAYDAIKILKDLLNDEDLLMINKNCLPLTFERRKLPETLFSGDPELEYSLKLHLTSKQIIPVFGGPNEELIKEKLTKDMYYYLENLDYPGDMVPTCGGEYRIISAEDIDENGCLKTNTTISNKVEDKEGKGK